MGAGCWHMCVIKLGMYVIASNHWWPVSSCPPTKATPLSQLYTIPERPATLLTNTSTATYQQMTHVSLATLHSPANENRSTVSTCGLPQHQYNSYTQLTNKRHFSLPKSQQHRSATFLARRPSRKKCLRATLQITPILLTHLPLIILSSVPTLGQWNLTEIKLSKYELTVQQLKACTLSFTCVAFITNPK
jgi:hypothetical protein